MSRRPGNEKAKMNRLRNQAFIDQDGLCFFCHVPMVMPEPGHIPFKWTCTADHYPKRYEDGGRAVKGNIVASCCECNMLMDVGHKLSLILYGERREQAGN